MIDTKAGDLMIKVAEKLASLADNYPEEEQLHLANQLRDSASVISPGRAIIKPDLPQQKGEFTRRIKRIENSLLEVINNLKIALLCEYINKNDYDEVYSMMEKLHRRLITLKKPAHGDQPLLKKHLR